MKTYPSLTRPPKARGGFTLLEIIIAIAILTIMIGAAVPVTSKLLTYKARKATLEELQSLSNAASDYFADTKVLPSSVGALLTASGIAGWSGPYLPGVVTDQVSGKSGYEVDAWSRAYQFSAAGDVLKITSPGEDAQVGDSNDLSIALDVTWIRREETLDELALLNQAVLLYNGQYQVTEPLSSNWSAALSKLVIKGLLPSNSDHETDGWGKAYVGDPAGNSPLVKLQSPSLTNSSGSNSGKQNDQGNSKSGKGKGGNSKSGKKK